MSAQSISRRDFIKRVGIGGAATTAAWLLDGRVAPVYAAGGSGDGAVGVLIDLTRCAGCNSCALACQETHGLPDPDVVPAALSVRLRDRRQQRQEACECEAPAHSGFGPTFAHPLPPQVSRRRVLQSPAGTALGSA